MIKITVNNKELIIGKKFIIACILLLSLGFNIYLYYSNYQIKKANKAMLNNLDILEVEIDKVTKILQDPRIYSCFE